jgi:hypothetical protein
MIATILLVLAFISAVLAAVGVDVPHVNCGWLAIALWILSVLVGGAHAVVTLQ